MGEVPLYLCDPEEVLNHFEETHMLFMEFRGFVVYPRGVLNPDP